MWKAPARTLVGAELAVLPWPSVGAAGALGASLLVVDASRRLGGPGTVVMWLGLAALGMAAAFTVDDAAVAVTAAVPVRQARRLVVRLLVPAGLFGLWMAYAAVAVRDPDAGLSLAALGVTGAGVLLLSLGAASLARSAGMPEPGSIVAPVVLLAVMAGVTLPFLPGHVHLLLAVDVPGRVLVAWAIIIVVHVGALVWAGSDSWSRPHA